MHPIDSLLAALMGTGGLPQVNYGPTQDGGLGEYSTHTQGITIDPRARLMEFVLRHELGHALQDRTVGMTYQHPIDTAIRQRLGLPMQDPSMSRDTAENFANFAGSGGRNGLEDPLTFMLMRALSHQIFGQALGR